MKKILFHRDYNGYTGGHGMMYEYFKGFCNCPDFNTYIYFTPQSIIDKNNPWYNCDNIVKEWNPDNADILFLGGLDWRDVPETCKTPVINLIQGIGHADNKSELYKFLTRYAIRICVSKEVTRALINTDIVNGPIYTIENHITIPKYIRELNNKNELSISKVLLRPTIRMKH